MTTITRKLPAKIIAAIEQEKLSTNHVIYYDPKDGWVYQRRDNTSVNSIHELVEQNSYTNRTNESAPLEKLGPFGTKPTNISLAIIQGTEMYQMTLDKNLTKLDSIDGYGQHAPIAPVTLAGRARDVAYIPRDATHFCWVYPPAGFTQLSKKQKAKIEQEMANDDLEYTFLALGGFVYFRFEQHSYRMLRANCLVQADNGLTFHGPFQWRSSYTADLAKQGRFQNVTISTLSDLGIKYYCFINPNEKLTSSNNESPDWIPAPNGGFIYLYDSKLESHEYDRYFCVSDTPLSEKISTHVMPFSLIRKRKKSGLLTNIQPVLNTSSSLNSDMNNKFMCSICLERTIRCMFIPCKHMCACSECAQDVRQRLNSVCPMCRRIFNEIWDVFL